MYLSDIIQVSEFLNESVKGAVISGIFRSRGGTLIKLFGSNVCGIYFNLLEKVLFPVSDITQFKKEPLTRLEEGLRANISGRISAVSTLPDHGKVIKIELFETSLIIPLFKNRAVRIIDRTGALKWIERNDNELQPLEIPMKYFEPLTSDPTHYESMFIEKQQKKRADEIKKAVEKKRKKLVSGIEMLEKKRADYIADIEKYSVNASLIKANLYSLDPSQRKEVLELTDFSGATVTLALDPAKTVVENMERFFLKVKKAKSGIIHTEKRIASAKMELAGLELDSIIQQPENTEEKQVVQKKRTQNVHKPYHEFHSPDGAVFLVGKEAKDNDELTFKISSPHDIWFHAKDYHGSHVILKMKKGELPKSENILNGCILAITYSKAKKGMSGEVWFTERKNVMKKKGMPAGTVTFKNAKSKYISNAVLPEKLLKIDS
ncbi:MAG TPA: NFACT RNA binding domain-containing protein, partial [bacterium]|nr:NFACT RNA binding domain-containing protein [bacterium]